MRDFACSLNWMNRLENTSVYYHGKLLYVENETVLVNEAINILRNPIESKCISTAPLNVRGGEVYVFKPNSADKEGKPSS